MNNDSEINQEISSKVDISSANLHRIGLWEKWCIALFKCLDKLRCKRGENVEKKNERIRKKQEQKKLKLLHLPEFTEQNKDMERQQGVDEEPEDQDDLDKSDDSFGNITIKKQKIPLK